ncbi:Developmentally regulated GTP-binding protein 1 [Spironucleus salmonicida]|uniref:Developmentally regulated GTP-binding protein 1 n=1 Tax=Spironucleus salmonicida TaxID=348837 RepID=V6LW05_9EUKA|nr:Developmentally regulated GTP-binding protein 1 [Spironucleus salmonicida]|eukprot:EST48812.1 Developmentally regulated GTP-binding protein 1 [Spironucleus salmonicida]
MGIVEQIEAIKAEQAITQKNKATNYHMGRLKARLAALESQLLSEQSKTGPKGQGFEVQKVGQARAAMIGFPSTGKSSLLCALTNSKSVVAAYEFTTLTCIPGQMFYNNAQVQILDLPGIISGAADNKGKGKQVIATARTADLIIVMLDALRAEQERKQLEKELFDMGIRLNQQRPNVEIVRQKTGGVKVNFTVNQSNLTYDTVKAIMQEFKYHNCDIFIRDDISTDQLVDVICGSRVYAKAIYVVNKIDMISVEAVNYFANQGYIPISVSQELGLAYLKQKIWENLEICRIYTRKRGEHPDLTDAIFMKKGDTVQDVCGAIHKELVQGLQYGQVWGRSVNFQGQRVSNDHVVQDGDVVQIVVK